MYVPERPSACGVLGTAHPCCSSGISCAVTNEPSAARMMSYLIFFWTKPMGSRVQPSVSAIVS